MQKTHNNVNVKCLGWWLILLDPFKLGGSFTGKARSLPVTEWYGGIVLNLYFKNLKEKNMLGIFYFSFELTLIVEKCLLTYS